MADTFNLGPLFDRARGGDAVAWNALLARLRPFVRTLCRRRATEADASDLTQEVQWRLDRGFARFRGDSLPQFLAWVRVITARVVLKHHQTRALPVVPLPESDGPPARKPASRWFDSEELIRLTDALERLPEHYRQVIEGRLFDGLSCIDLAQRLGRTPVWVRVTCKRAVERLHQELGVQA